MKTKTKKIIASSFILFSFATISIWYFFPVLLSKWLLSKDSGLEHNLSVTPTYLTELPEAPQEWSNILIDDLAIKLPMLDINQIQGKETFINFTTTNGSILLTDLAQSKEARQLAEENNYNDLGIPYESLLAIKQASPTDISFTNSRTNNIENSTNLTLKAISTPEEGIRKIIVTNQSSSKAIATINNKNKCGFNATADIYSHNGKMKFSMFLKSYRNESILYSDLLMILNGIKLPEHPLNATTVENDIASMKKTYNKTTTK